MNMYRINEIIDRAIESGAETGAAFVLTKDGKSVHDYSAGLADIAQNKPFTPDTICRAFSCTKVVTAVAAMILMERGRLDTAYPIEWFIPEFKDAYYIKDGEKIASPQIRIRDLLNMTSGISYPGGGYEGADGMNKVWGDLEKSIRDGKSMTTREFAAAAGKAPLAYPSGREWMYGSSADVLGAVIEILADTELSEFYAKNIFEPLGMEDTAFFVPPEKRDRLGVLYEGSGKDAKPIEWVNLCIFDYDSKPLFQSGGAGLFSTARDFAKLGAELSFGGAGVISRRAVDFMRENGLTPEQKITFNWDSTRGYGYANLVRCLEDRNAAGTFATKGAFGWDGWTGTYLLCDPAEKTSVTLFVQRAGGGTTQLSRDIVNAVYAAL